MEKVKTRPGGHRANGTPLRAPLWLSNSRHHPQLLYQPALTGNELFLSRGTGVVVVGGGENRGALTEICRQT